MKRVILAFAAFLTLGLLAPGARYVYAIEVPVTNILPAATATSTGSSFRIQQGIKTYQAAVVGTGSVSATVIVEVNNDLTATLPWTTICTFTLSGTTSDGTACVSLSSYALVRARITAIAGTSATVNVIMGSGL